MVSARARGGSDRRPRLRALAERFGVLPSYVDQEGVLRRTTDRTRVALLAALGVDASTEAAAGRALATLRVGDRERPVPPVRVVSARDTRRLALGDLALRTAGRGPAALAAIEIEIDEEGGGRQRVGAHGARQLETRLARPLPPGYHTLRVALTTRAGTRHEGNQRLIVHPGRCLLPREVLGHARAYGILAQLYSVRSEADWGIGDLGVLGRLIDWAGGIGAAFVGLNPLHALSNRDGDISPYSPVSRLFRNVIYLDVRAVPELAHAPAAARHIASARYQRALARLRATAHVPYGEVMAVKETVLRLLHRVFVSRHTGRGTGRGRAYARYVDAQGDALRDFAVFLVLRAHLTSRHGADWRRWPMEFRDPASDAVRRFAAAHADDVDFHCYLQFELDRQLAGAAARARVAGLGVGLYEDLAIGSSPTGSDTWALPGLFVTGATLGAPPDAWYRRGQDWGFQPLDPRRLAATGYDYWIRLVRVALAHAGALRIDHVIGLSRQFWIPSGRTPAEGAYVRFPAADLLGILALESTRAGALVIGEDLGTVPRHLPRLLAEWGVLSTRVLYFARDRRGAFLPARAYPAQALVSANTHDMAPLAGYWVGRDLELRWRAGQMRSRSGFEKAKRDRRAELRALARRLAAEGVLSRRAAPDPEGALRGAVHAFLCRTPAALVGLSLDDVVGEREPVNLPGAGLSIFPSWSRRLRVPVERLPTAPEVRAALGPVLRTSRARGSGAGRRRGRQWAARSRR